VQLGFAQADAEGDFPEVLFDHMRRGVDLLALAHVGTVAAQVVDTHFVAQPRNPGGCLFLLHADLIQTLHGEESFLPLLP